MATVGCTIGYNRGWHRYNEKLVERGTMLFDLSWISTFDDDLRRMNARKRGHPYTYTDGMIAYLGRLASAFGMQYRSLEGHLKMISGAANIRVPDFSTIWRRITRMIVPSPAGDGGGIAAAVDSTGIRVGARGEWMREKWNVHKGWIKLHVLIDVRTNRILSYIVTDERSGDPKHLLVPVDKAVAAGHRITKVRADGAYDARYNWNGLKERGIEFVTNICRNAVAVSKGCMVRSRAVAERGRMGTDAWKEKHGYNMRWKVESAFSDYKRMFGDSVRSHKAEYMVREIDRTISLFNRMKGV